jgi:Fe-S cluster assembly protein SufD
MTTTFTPDLARQLPGPDWLRARRAEAAEALDGLALPSEAEEVWRYSRIGQLDLDAYHPLVAPPATSPPVVPEPPAVGDRAGLLVTVNGSVVRAELDPALAARGVVLGARGEDAEGVGNEATDAFGVLNAAFRAGTVVLHVPDGVAIPADRPMVIVHHVDGDGAGAAVFPHVAVTVGRDAEVTVVDQSTSADVDALVVPLVELDVAEAGRLHHLTVQALGPRVWQVARQASRVGRDATLRASAVALGGYYARSRTDSRLVGQGGSSELLAAYYADGDQMHDFRTLQDHAAPSTTSDLLFKGAVQDRARGVYSGLIRVEKAGQKTNAFQTNRNLVLSEGAHADSVPNLEIEANDVRCSHATAVGPIDEEQRYYVESRGVPPEQAERLIVLGFFRDVLVRMPVPALTSQLRSAMAAKLDHRSER